MKFILRFRANASLLIWSTDHSWSRTSSPSFTSCVRLKIYLFSQLPSGNIKKKLARVNFTEKALGSVVVDVAVLTDVTIWVRVESFLRQIFKLSGDTLSRSLRMASKRNNSCQESDEKPLQVRDR